MRKFIVVNIVVMQSEFPTTVAKCSYLESAKQDALPVYERVGINLDSIEQIFPVEAIPSSIKNGSDSIPVFAVMCGKIYLKGRGTSHYISLHSFKTLIDELEFTSDEKEELLKVKEPNLPILWKGVSAVY